MPNPSPRNPRWRLAGVLLLPLGGLLGLALFSPRPRSVAPPPPLALTPSVPSPVLTPPPPVATPTPAASAAATPTPRTPPSPGPRTQPSLSPEEAALNQRTAAKYWASRPSVDALIEVRVAIAEAVSSLSWRTSTAALLVDQTGQPLQTLSANTTYAAEPVGNAVHLQGASLPQVVMIDPSPLGIFYLGDRPYRGRLLLVADAGRLWAINYVNLRSYLHSVVGAEVSADWPVDALKAQAVAARSYALTYHFQPAHSAYDLGATERYQVYRGTIAEAPTIRQAVDATAGEFVSYRGGVVESLYAASEDIVMEAFQGRGMSQLGALDLASRGQTYEQILRHYYPDTGVGRIEVDAE